MCWVLVDSYDPPESIGTKKSTNIPCMTSQWRHTLCMSKNAKIAKNHQNRRFSHFFQQKLHYLAMMCVRECLHTFLLQINQMSETKHSGSTQKRQKHDFICNFNGKSSFSLTQLAITWRGVITLGPIFTKMVLNRAQGSKEKSQEVSVRQNVNQRRYNKKFRRGGGFRPPLALLGLK